MKESKLAKRQTQTGFTMVEGLLVALVLAALVFGAIYIMGQQDEDETEQTTTTQTTQQQTDEDTTPTEVPEEINNQQDLQQAEDALQDIDIEGLDEPELYEESAELL